MTPNVVRPNSYARQSGEVTVFYIPRVTADFENQARMGMPYQVQCGRVSSMLIPHKVK
jgi:hypothetical protein